MTDSFEFTLNNPLTEEQWDMITDVDFDRTDHVTFHTKHGKEVEFTKVIRCKDCKFYEVAELNYDGTPDKRCKPSICANGWYEYAVERDPNWFCADAEPKDSTAEVRKKLKDMEQRKVMHDS